MKIPLFAKHFRKGLEGEIRVAIKRYLPREKRKYVKFVKLFDKYFISAETAGTDRNGDHHYDYDREPVYHSSYLLFAVNTLSLQDIEDLRVECMEITHSETPYDLRAERKFVSIVPGLLEDIQDNRDFNIELLHIFKKYLGGKLVNGVEFYVHEKFGINHKTVRGIPEADVYWQMAQLGMIDEADLNDAFSDITNITFGVRINWSEPMTNWDGWLLCQDDDYIDSNLYDDIRRFKHDNGINE